MKKITSFEAACESLKISTSLPACSGILERPQIAFYKLSIIGLALNGKWTPDWSNSNQKKYYPWFNIKDGRFVFYDVYYHYTNSYLGSRLCYKDERTARYAATQFEDLYNDLLR